MINNKTHMYQEKLLLLPWQHNSNSLLQSSLSHQLAAVLGNVYVTKGQDQAQYK